MQQNEKFSLAKEFLRKRTIFSLALSLFFIYLFLSHTTVGEIARHMKKVDPLFLILAFLSHYLSYVIRGDRWRRMIFRNGFSGGAATLAGIIFLFQSINCLLPGKVGDFYGAHLMKLNFSLSRSFSLGSIFLWRVLDFMILMAFVVVTAFTLFGNRIPLELIFAIKVAGLFLLVLLALTGLFLRYHTWLTISFKSKRIKRLIASFRGGLSLNAKIIPSLLVTTTIIWFLEAGRFFFVCKSMAVEVNLIPVVFITLSAALFTAVPFTPSGLGAVELGMLRLLALVGIGNPVAYPLIIWDRFIAHWSQIFLGIVLIVFSKTLNLKIWHFQPAGGEGSSTTGS